MAGRGGVRCAAKGRFARGCRGARDGRCAGCRCWRRGCSRARRRGRGATHRRPVDADEAASGPVRPPLGLATAAAGEHELGEAVSAHVVEDEDRFRVGTWRAVSVRHTSGPAAGSRTAGAPRVTVARRSRVLLAAFASGSFEATRRRATTRPGPRLRPRRSRPRGRYAASGARWPRTRHVRALVPGEAASRSGRLGARARRIRAEGPSARAALLPLLESLALRRRALRILRMLRRTLPSQQRAS